jgi:hypothetical protein
MRKLLALSSLLLTFYALSYAQWTQIGPEIEGDLAFDV